MFWKRKYIIKFWGEKLGKIIHFVGYVIVPIVVGVYFIWKEPTDDAKKYDLLCNSVLSQCVIMFIVAGAIVNYLI